VTISGVLPAEPVLTIGHSTRSLEQMVDLLEAYGVQHLLDVRRHTGSRRCPHFTGQHLARALPARGIAYTHFPELGGSQGRNASNQADADTVHLSRMQRAGLAHAGNDYDPLVDVTSANAAWRSRAFRAFADYMSTASFARAAEVLEAHAAQERVTLMCAAAVPWRCHRQLIADWLVAHGHDVWHILGSDQPMQHALNPAARQMPDGSLIYPEGDQLRLPS
jgi:uncharacterized protein (DUF488 family)